MELMQEMENVRARLRAYLESLPYWQNPYSPQHLDEAVRSYLEAGGKYLRPCLMLWTCRALGGEEQVAVPAALAVEIFHTWTLVHDDIVDRDDTRRGRPTIHADFQRKGAEQFALKEDASHYGRSIAVLAGDVQHGLVVATFADSAAHNGRGADPLMVLDLIRELEGDVLPKLIEGEVVDLQLSYRPLPEAAEAEVLHMIGGKTAALFAFCARAGANFAIGKYSPKDAIVNAIGDFGYHVGMAFQLQDDVLGITGDAGELGKPVGSDIREGKRTVPLVFSWQHASPEQRAKIERTAGSAKASQQEIDEVHGIVEELGGIAHARELAQRHLKLALTNLKHVQEGAARQLLESFARFAVNRRH